MAELSAKRPKEPPIYRIGPFQGVNVSSTPTEINDNQSPDMLNLNIDERGALNKRTGYERLFPTSLGEGKINGLFNYRKDDGSTILLIAHGTKLYTQTGEEQPVEIYSGLADYRTKFFVMAGKCYIQDGTNYLVYDVETVSEIDPYIPTLTISRPPSGGGEAYEDFNLLGAGFKDSFSSDGTATVYQLSLKGLDATTLTAEVNEATMTEGSGFSVNRSTGKVTFNTAPSEGTNNVIITAYKTQTDFPDRIKKCQFNVLFGGSNDTRVFVSGNPDSRNQIWRSGLNDPSYFPENGFYKVGTDSTAVQGFSKQYDYLLIEKENSKWNMRYELPSGAAEPSFPIKPINDQAGTIARDSIEMIENSPISLDKKGVYVVMSSNVRDERNVQHVSENVDSRLLIEPNLDQAVAVDFDKKYWLCVNGNVFVYDYTVGEWYLYDNIHANCFLVIDRTLYFGGEGLVYQFKRKSHTFPYNDDGEAINAHWYSKLIDFKQPEYYKLVKRIYQTIKPNTHTSSTVYIRTDVKGETLVITSRSDKLDFFDIDFDRFGFSVSDVPQQVAKKVKEKKITHFQIKLENKDVDESLGLISIGLKFNYQNEVK
jgi:hypothetical protein